MRASREPSIFERHAKLAVVGVTLGMMLFILIIGEIIARLAITYNPQYYTVVRSTKGEIHFPFGTIKINSRGYPDDEFDLEDPRPRIGYMGDSVTYGIGAGYGYRFSDLLEARFPNYQHMTFGSVADGFRSRQRMERVVKQAKSLGIDLLIYFYNLNDTLPNSDTFGGQRASDDPWYLGILRFVRHHTDLVRRHSYLLNWIRYRVRILLGRFGIEYTGYRAFELFPNESRDVIDSTAARINYLAEMLADSGISFAVVLLPYEMQISAEAQQRYAGFGVQWEKEFIARGTQKRLREVLDADIPVYDAYEAFVGSGSDRADIRVGEFFVYDRGDMLDWNHPNRAGHAKIADWLSRTPLFTDPTWARVNRPRFRTARGALVWRPR